MNNKSERSVWNRKSSLNTLIKIAMLSAISAVLMFFEFPMPFMPPFLKMDFSDLPAVIATFSFGPLAGICVELVKNLLHLVSKGSSTGGVGELANFLIGTAFVLPAGLIYMKNKTKKGAIIGMCAGTVLMAVTGVLANYYILIPFYVTVMNFPMNAILSMCGEVNGLISNLPTLIAFGITPFNILKGVMLSIVTALLYKRLSPLLHGK